MALERAAQELVAHAMEKPQAFGIVAITLADPRRLVQDDAPAHIGELTALVADLARWMGMAIVAGEHSPGDPMQRAIRWLFGLFGTLQLAKLSRFEARLSPEHVTPALAHDLLAAMVRWRTPMTHLLALALGALGWTFTEYVLHRFDGHGMKGKTPFSREHLAPPRRTRRPSPPPGRSCCWPS